MKSLSLYLVFFLSVIFTVLSPPPVYAAKPLSRERSTEEILLRNQLEKEVAERFKQLIGTQLPQGTYEVSVSVQLSINPPKNNPKADSEKKEESDDLKRLDFASVDVEKIVFSYEKEIAFLKEKLKSNKAQNEEKDAKNIYSVQGISIYIGLDESYSDTYVGQFKEWLKKTVANTYGESARWNVEKIQRSAHKITPYEMAKDFKELLGLGAIAAALLIGNLVFTLRSLIAFNLATKNELDSKNSLQHGKSEISLLGQPQNPKGPDPVKANGENLLNAGKSAEFEVKLIQKIAGILEQMEPHEISKLIESWTSMGKLGARKFYLLLDAIVTTIGNMRTISNGVPARISAFIDTTYMKNSEQEAAEEYLALKEMSIEERLTVLNEIYWELIGLFSLGSSHLRKPFDFLVNLSSQQRAPILESQSLSEKMVTVLCLPKSIQGDVLNSLDLNEKVEIIKEAYQQKTLSAKDINDVETSLQIRTIHAKEGKAEAKIDLFPKTIEVLRNMNIYDEIKVLTKMMENMNDRGLSLAHQYFSFAFLPMWKAEYVKKLAGMAQVEELLALSGAVAGVEEILLQNSPERMRIMLKDELERKKDLRGPDTIESLTRLREKFEKLIKSDGIDYSQVLAETGATSSGVSHAA